MEAAKQIDWVKFPTYALNSSRSPVGSWYEDGLVNTCYNALDRHVADGMGENIAIIYIVRLLRQKRKYHIMNSLLRLIGLRLL